MSRRELLRINATVEVEFKTFDQFYKEYSKNLSKGGMFIKTDKLLKPQSVLEILLKLPGLEKPLSLVGEVVHVIDVPTARARNWDAGMGVHFVDFEEGAQKVLSDYVARQYQAKPELRPPDRRRHPRNATRLRVKFPSMDVLQHDYAEDISRGGIFIQTQKPRTVGERFIVVLVHPQTAEELELMGEVVHVITPDGQKPGTAPGMGIKFLDLDEEKHQLIERFLALDWPAGDF